MKQCPCGSWVRTQRILLLYLIWSWKGYTYKHYTIPVGVLVECNSQEQLTRKIQNMNLPARLPIILWPLLVYEFPLTTVEMIESTVSTYLKRWLGIPRSFSSVELYSTRSKLQLSLKSLAEAYKVTRQVMMLRDSRDPQISTAFSRYCNTNRQKVESACWCGSQLLD